MKKVLASELRYRRLFESARDGILILDAETGEIDDVNPFLIKLLGYSREEFIEKELWEVGAFKDAKASKEAFEELQRKKYIRYEDLPLKAKDGRIIQVEFVSNVYLVEGKKVIQCNIRDISERVLADKRSRFQASLIANTTDAIVASDVDFRITEWNNAAELLYGWKAKEVIGHLGLDITRTEWPTENAENMRRLIAESGHWRGEATQQRKDGTRFPVEISSTVLFDGSGKIVGYLSLNHDITEKKRAYQEIVSLAKFPAENPYPVLRLGGNGTVLYANASAFLLLRLWDCAVGGFVPQSWRETIASVLGSGNNKTVEIEIGEKIYSIIITPVTKEGYVNLYGRDITERKKSEGLVSLQSHALNAAANAIMITNDEGTIEWVNSAFAKLTGYSAQEAIGRNPRDLVKSGEQGQAFYKRIWDTILGGEVWRGEIINRRKDESLYTEDLTITPIKDTAGNIEHFIAIKQDITERKVAEDVLRKSEEQNRFLYQSAQKHLSQTVSLRRIDVAITNSLDLKFILGIVLDQVIEQLQVDAADILLYNPALHRLEFCVGKGFRTVALQNTTVPMGVSFAGRAVLERRRIDIPDLTKENKVSFSHLDQAFEHFVDYHVLPLMVKGKVLGVLGTFKRNPFEADAAWLDYLDALGGQAAIAIDSATLFNDLQTSNDQMVLSYDTTIEGWSRALDLRDKETEGHTQRVTFATIQLARQMGLSDEKLVHMRRGALLHDIGKMGIPDAIMLKPGPLTAEEWAIMKQHPQFAQDLLAPIAYLQDALDIPYCHHEKWDGTGYPRGLKGDLIPLAARIFAVEDVYDALTSDRAYRKGWTKEKALAHIEEQSGKHFDPQVVEKFLQYLN